MREVGNENALLMWLIAEDVNEHINLQGQATHAAIYML